jgi:RNA polymerase sigma-70 factor (ECF subfamily)
MIEGTTIALPTVVLSAEVRLLNRVRDRTDAMAWTEFMGVYQPVIRAFVRLHGIAASDVPDVVQDIFVRLVPTLAQFQFDPSRGQFRTWLWRVASNAACNWLRKKASLARIETSWREQQSGRSAEDDSDERERTRRQQLLDQVLVEVRSTTLPATWACFEGRVLRDRPAVELAVELGVSKNSVYVNASRVLAQVRKRCAQSLGVNSTTLRPNTLMKETP